MAKNITVFFISSLLFAYFNSCSGQTTFSYTGGMQTYVVPNGVTSIIVTVRGAQGGNGVISNNSGIGLGGAGGSIQGTLSVIPGTILYLFVGGAGTTYSGGYNGGGNSHDGYYTGNYFSGGGGGGASDIRIGGTALSNRVLIAGGGGGGGGGVYNGYDGGKGGNNVGQEGIGTSTSTGGKGGNQSGGGAGGTPSFTTGVAGSYGNGGVSSGSAGGGGGGFYGGGGGGVHTSGGYSYSGAGGGGGSSNYSTSVVSNANMSQGNNMGNGSIMITPLYTPTVISLPATNVTSISATLNGQINDNGSTTTVAFEYSTDPSLSTGLTIINSNPLTINAGMGNTSVNATASSLKAYTTYYYRVKGTNNIGTVYGSILNFTTSNTSPTFLSGNLQTLTICQNSSMRDITSLLHISDADTGQKITWSLYTTPNSSGKLDGFSTLNTASSGSLNISPSNAVYYTPQKGFSGTEIFIVQISDGISIDTCKFIITVTPLPIPLISQNGTILTTGNFSTYQWFKDSVLLIGDTNSSITVLSNGKYHVIVSDINGCVAISNVFYIGSVTANNIENNFDLDIFPNPVQNTLTIKSPIKVKVSISDVNGKIVIHKTEASNIDVSEFTEGIYILIIYTQNEIPVAMKKLIKK